jgi:hypothetical protein
MPISYQQRRKEFEYLLQNKTTDGSGSQTIKVHGGRSTLKCWGTFDSATVLIQLLAEDGVTWITAFTFTQAGVQFCELGSLEETFKAVVANAGASTDLTVTMSY